MQWQLATSVLHDCKSYSISPNNPRCSLNFDADTLTGYLLPLIPAYTLPRRDK